MTRRLRRRAAKLTQAELAQRAGVSASAVHRWERGDDVSLRIERLIDEALRTAYNALPNRAVPLEHTPDSGCWGPTVTTPVIFVAADIYAEMLAAVPSDEGGLLLRMQGAGGENRGPGVWLDVADVLALRIALDRWLSTGDAR